MQKSLLNFFTKAAKAPTAKPESSDVDAPFLLSIPNDAHGTIDPRVKSFDNSHAGPTTPTSKFSQLYEVPDTSLSAVTLHCCPKIEGQEKTSFAHKRRRVILESSDEEECANESVVPTSLPERSPEVRNNVRSVDLSDFSHSPLNLREDSSYDHQTSKSSNFPVFKDSFEGQTVTWEHLELSFLKEERIRDASRRRPGDPDFDPKTLYVPQDFLVKQTPAMRQWWELKSKYADVLLFFKVGKFYELYHMDAMIAVELLGLVFMKGSFAHCGFPEVAFQRMADLLVNKGYKVGRVEQTESVDAMSVRTKGKPCSEKVVRREICQLVCPGTSTASARTDISSSVVSSCSDSEDFSTFKEVGDNNQSILLALCEDRANLSSNEFIFGVAVLNASNGKIIFGQFPDDRHCSRLRTLLSQCVPNQILVERASISRAVKSLLKTSLSGIPVEHLTSGKQFWSAKDTIVELETADYFSDGPEIINTASEKFPGKRNWPKAILETLSEDDALGHSVKPDSELAVRCLGAIVYYLRYCLIDREVLSLGFIEEYHPLDAASEFHTKCTEINLPFYTLQSSLILDSITLANLDVLHNSSTGTREGTLLERLDTCCTSFGRRLLRQWLSAPPCNPDSIRSRQDAVHDLIVLKDSIRDVKESLRRLPDLERLITKIHLLGSRGKDKTHPDNRAVIFEELQYSRKNLVDFAATLDGLELACNIQQNLGCLAISSKYLRSLTVLKAKGGQFPSLKSKIEHFKGAFNVEKAKRDGRVIPEPGIDPSYDDAIHEINLLHTELDRYLLKCGGILGSRVTYWGTARNRYQIEVPESSVSRVPSNWQLASQRKGVKRYRTTETVDFLARMTSAEERRDACLRSITHTIFSSFSQSFPDWLTATRCLAELDCLMALATYSMNASFVTCRPEFFDLAHPSSSQPFLEIVDGFHPCLTNTYNGGDLIPNSVCLGSSKPLTVLVTGPNMGGKSTLMRQTALLVILSHMGCLVPAKLCRLTPVDRIFSRLGASDRLLAGESTFMVELSETAAILRHISPHSLVLMDELGRGTSTHDGTALAGAVLRYLANPPGSAHGPRTLFSTHYHSLVDDVAGTRKFVNESIGLGHMACMVEEQNKTDFGLENITFLYKFIPGACPKSYGFNAARLAHLPDAVIQTGLVKAKEFERTSTTLSCLQNVLTGTVNAEQAREWVTKLKAFT